LDYPQVLMLPLVVNFFSGPFVSVEGRHISRIFAYSDLKVIKINLYYIFNTWKTLPCLMNYEKHEHLAIKIQNMFTLWHRVSLTPSKQLSMIHYFEYIGNLVSSLHQPRRNVYYIVFIPHSKPSFLPTQTMQNGSVHFFSPFNHNRI
jgi:hypothetical protein